MPRYSSIGQSLGFGAAGGVLSASATFNTTPSSINEGSAGSFGITTTNFPSGTLYWTINHHHKINSKQKNTNLLD